MTLEIRHPNKTGRQEPISLEDLMSPEKRLDAIVDILARGVLRFVDEERFNVSRMDLLQVKKMESVD